LQQEYRRIKKKNKEEEKGGEGEDIYICGYIWLMDITTKTYGCGYSLMT